MSCEQVHQQTTDYLYGELVRGEREEFERHLAGCDDCRRRLAQLTAARATLRAALTGPLSESAPSGPRRAALRAAESRQRRRRLWDWWRRPWALPLAVSCGAVAMFLLVQRPLLDGSVGARSAPTSSPIALPPPSAPAAEEAPHEPSAPAAKSAPATGGAVERPASRSPARKRASSRDAHPRSSVHGAPAPAASRARLEGSAPPPPAGPAPGFEQGSGVGSAPAAPSAAAEDRAEAADAPSLSRGAAQLETRGEHLFRAGRWEEAAAIYDELLRRFPKSERAAFWRARLQAARGAAAPPPL